MRPGIGLETLSKMKSTNDCWVSNPDIPTKLPAHEIDLCIYSNFFFFVSIFPYICYIFTSNFRT